MKENGCGCTEKRPVTITGSCCTESKPEIGCCDKGAGDGGKLVIDFMYLDITSCDRCLGTDSSLEEAIAEVSGVLTAVGYGIEVRKTLVESERQARKLGFMSSPKIRINGRDIQLGGKESLCDSCGDICGDEVNCRVWTWRGQEYTAPPKGMIIDAILRSIYGNHQAAEQFSRKIPANLKKFYSAKNTK